MRDGTVFVEWDYYSVVQRKEPNTEELVYKMEMMVKANTEEFNVLEDKFSITEFIVRLIDF